jgi:protein involved in polysaccharide export with SLBB domain
MKKNLSILFILSIFIFTHNEISAQTLDEAFLKSLPRSIQEDLTNRAEGDEALDDKNYNKKPDTRLLNIEEAIEALKDDLESIENEVALETDQGQNDLEIFGSSFFNSYQTSFSPVNNPRFISDYILDVDDVIKIEIIGKTTNTKKQKVQQDGTVNIPSFGNVRVAGLTFSDAKKVIEDHVNKKTLGTEVFFSLDVLRDINILLVGSVDRPGIYTLPGGSDILSVLHAAGGLSETGSFRSILHKRNNQILQEIDLYDTIIYGNLIFEHPLRSGDSLVVNPVRDLVSISGAINVPAIYELKAGETLGDLINLAQGIRKGNQKVIEVISPNGDQETFNFPVRSNLPIEDGYSVHIPMYLPSTREIFTVTISGAVKSPGRYAIQPGESLAELIVKAGGYSENAYPMGGQLFRKRVAELQKEMLNKSYRELINYLASTPGGTGGLGLANSQNLQIILPELKNVQPKGRLAVEFNLKKIEADSSLNTVLQHQDEIHIPYFSTEVFLFGEVQNPGAISHKSGLSYNDYIKTAGGLGRFAENEKILIIQPNGEGFLANKGIQFFKESNVIYPGTIIYVPREIGKLEGISFAATLAPIMSSLALSLASLNSID